MMEWHRQSHPRADDGAGVIMYPSPAGQSRKGKASEFRKSLLRIPPFRAQSAFSEPGESPMSTKPTPQPNNPDSKKPTSGSPPWYPDLPENLVSKSCLIILWAIMTGQSLSTRDGNLTNSYMERLKEALAGRAELTPELILEMANSVYPGATHDIIRAFLRGITETVIVSQSVPLPAIKNFLADYPHIQPLEEKLKSLADANDALAAIRAATKILKEKMSPEHSG